MPVRRLSTLLTLAGVTLAYFVAGRIGLALAFVNQSTSAVWPASGVAVAATLLMGPVALPAVAIGAFLVNVTTTGDVLASIIIALGNTLECIAAAALTRGSGRLVVLDRAAHILRFAASAMIAATIAASVGTLTLQVFGLAGSSSASLIWVTWWLGDAIGMVMLVPMCVLWAAPRTRTERARAEELALVASVVIVLVAVFGINDARIRDLPYAFIMVPVLLWSAFRFGPRATATLSVIVAIIATYRVIHNFGPISFGNPVISLVVIQTLVALFGVLMLSVSAELTMARRAELEIHALNETLERRVAERTEELTREHDRFAEAQAVAHVGSWEWDVVADTLWWSAEMCRVFGVTNPPANYQDYLLVVHPDDRELTNSEVRRAVEERRPFAIEQRIVRADGEVRVLQARGRAEFDSSNRLVRMMGIGHDITEQKQAEEERTQLIHEQAARREAEEQNQAKDAFLATLSHELRTPLNAALGWTHILRRSIGEGPGARAVQTVYRNLLLQAQLVSDILDVSRIAKGRLPLEIETVDLGPIVESAIDMVREPASARQVAIDVRTSGAPLVTGDSRRLQQVVWNLLSNAVKFAAERGRVAVSIVETDCVELTVEDDGPGIAPEFLPHVFEQFRQADGSVTREHGGLGLGLAIAHHIVELHHGTIAVSNRSEGGAVFVVRLPRAGMPTLDANAEEARDQLSLGARTSTGMLSGPRH
jgi:PAS domain S-box-containing protein